VNVVVTANIREHSTSDSRVRAHARARDFRP